MKDKAAFIKELGDLCIKYGIDNVVSLTYDPHYEEVTIIRKEYFGNTYTREILRVAFDSKAQMVLDIFERLV